MEDPADWEKLRRLQKLKRALVEIEKKLIRLIETFDWDYSKLLERDNSDMVTCSVDSQHRVSKNRIKLHDERCDSRSQGYNESDKIFPECSGLGSFISLTPHLINSITKSVSSAVVLILDVSFKTKQNKSLRPVPQTSASFDQNFNREEKLAIYDYVIANTKKQKTFPDLWSQVVEKKEEKKEMTVWEIAAAERNAKRRRASYRNKVHTNCKSHTQILREVIEVQMEALKEESKQPLGDRREPDVECYRSEEKRKFQKSSGCRNEEGDSRRRHYNSCDRYKRSRRDSRDNSDSRSRPRDKYRRKWKDGEGRSRFHK